jgi:16S rRNA (guanine527-N7)-methyltransferase
VTAASEPEAIIAQAALIDVVIDTHQAEQLGRFAALLEKWNRHFNLLSRKDIDRLWSRHILDSLSITSLLTGDRILDFGSGGGFPGLPLAVVNPQREFVLLDRHQRKCRFLDQVIGALELSNTRVICADVKELAGEQDTSFDCVTSRAVAPAEQVWQRVRSLLQPQGRLIVMAATGKAELTAPDGARCEQRHIPGLEQPHEVVIIDRHQLDG